MLASSPMPNLRLVRLLWAILISHSLLFAPLLLASSPVEPLNIVVTIPVLKDLTEQVGGPYVRVTSLRVAMKTNIPIPLNRAISSPSGKLGCCSKSVSGLKFGCPRW